MEKVDRHKATEAENISITYWWHDKAAEKVGRARLNNEGANMHLQTKISEKVGKGQSYLWPVLTTKGGSSFLECIL